MAGPAPFIIFSLPRSCSAWTAHWLNALVPPVSHDLAIDCDTVDEFLSLLATTVRGTCETGAIDAWRVIRRAIPDAKLATIHRPVEEVIASLAARGIEADRTQLEQRAADLHELAAEPGVLSVNFNNLVDESCCHAIQEHCLSIPFDRKHWETMAALNIQVDLAERMRKLEDRRPFVDKLKAEVTERISFPEPFVSVSFEPWAACAEECHALGRAHYDEARAGSEGQFHLNVGALQSLENSGLFFSCVARVDGILVGYCLWTREVSLETIAPMTAVQGPFFVVPGLTKHRIGERLLTVSERGLQSIGFRVFDYHHTMLGRGAKAGAMYRRRGAEPYQMHYRMTSEAQHG